LQLTSFPPPAELRKRWCRVQGDIRSLAQSECRGGVIYKAIVFRSCNGMRLWELGYGVLSRMLGVLGPGRSISCSVNTRPSWKASAAYISDCGDRAARSGSTHLIHSCNNSKAERHAPRERPARFHANPISRLYCSSQHPRCFSVAVLFVSGSHSQPPKMEPQTHAIARPSICNKPVRSNSSNDSHEQFRIDGRAYNLFSINQNLYCITTSW